MAVSGTVNSERDKDSRHALLSGERDAGALGMVSLWRW